MGRRELGVVKLDIMACFANDLDIADDSVLEHLVLQEFAFAHALGEALYSLDGFEDMRQIIGQALLVAAHMGTASASTFERNFSGSALGVSTSTDMPSS